MWERPSAKRNECEGVSVSSCVTDNVLSLGTGMHTTEGARTNTTGY